MADGDEVTLLVSGVRYGGFESIRVTRSIENIAGSFALGVNDRWGYMDRPWPIVEEDPCTVLIGKTTVIDGYVDKRSLSASDKARTLSYNGRDRAAALVDCSAVLKQWTYYSLDVAAFVAKLANPFGVPVSVQAGIKLAKVPKLVVSPGDSVYEAIKRALEPEGVLAVSDGAGGILLTRAGSDRAYALVEGQGGNIKAASVDYDGSERFRTYLIATQSPGTDEASGAATQIQATATDTGVQRAERIVLVRPDKGYTTADARKRADWEARVRAAKAESVSITVQGWRQGNGVLWPVNALVRVTAPRMIGVSGDMLISQVEHSISNTDGRTTTLKLVRPDAFTPEPKATVSGEGAWKEIAKGAL